MPLTPPLYTKLGMRRYYTIIKQSMEFVLQRYINYNCYYFTTHFIIMLFRLRVEY